MLGTDGRIFTPAPMSQSYTLWQWAGTDTTVDPGAGGVAITGTGNQPRTFAISKTDATGAARNWQLLQPGDNLTLTDDPAAPPITGFARYVATSVATDMGD